MFRIKLGGCDTLAQEMSSHYGSKLLAVHDAVDLQLLSDLQHVPSAAELLELDAVVGAEALWTTFVSSDLTPARLERLLRMLQAAPARFPPARAGHVLMLLKRPRDAEVWLGGFADRLSVAQRALVLCRLAEVEEGTRHLYYEVAGGVHHFGAATTHLDIAAQMRLEYALGIAELECDHLAKGRMHMQTAATLALMCGNPHVGMSVDNYLLRFEELRDPVRVLAQLRGVIDEAMRLGNQMLVTYAALQARDTLLRQNAFEEVRGLAESLPEYVGAGWWADAVNVFLRPSPALPILPTPMLALDLQDGFLLAAQASRHMALAARARVAGQLKEAAHHAGLALGLPAWQARFELPTLEMIYKLAHVAAHLYLDEPKQAARSLSELARQGVHKYGPVATWSFAVVLAQMLALGATYPADLHPELVMSNGLKALSEIPDNLMRGTVLRAVPVCAAGVAVLARRPDAPSALADVVASAVAVLGKGGLLLHGQPVANYPHEQGAAVLDAVMRGATLDTSERQTIRRHRAVVSGLTPSVALESDVERALGLLRRGVAPRGHRIDQLALSGASAALSRPALD